MFKGLCSSKEAALMIFVWVGLGLVFDQSIYNAVVLTTAFAISSCYDCCLPDLAPKKVWDQFFYIKIIVVLVAMFGAVYVFQHIGLKETVDTLTKPLVATFA